YLPQLRTLASYDGKHYIVPIGYTWTGIYYNTEIFNQYNLTPPKTWDEFIAICDTLVANGITPLSIGDDPWLGFLWFSYINMRLNGVQFHNQVLQGQISFNDARVQSTLEIWQSLFQRDYFVERPTNLSSLDTLTSVIRGDEGRLHNQKAVMVLVNNSDLEDLPAKFQAELDFFPFPTIDSTMPTGEIVDTYGYMVPNKSFNIPQALAFLTYMSSAEAQTILVQQTGGAISFIPAHPAVDQNSLSLQAQRGLGIIEESDAFSSRFILSMPNTLWRSIGRGYDKFVRNGGDAEGFIEILEETRQKAQAEGWFSN
ncbi:MAG: ABC transporter substrate-binding protein, partial [Chloroflexota bacterium]